MICILYVAKKGKQIAHFSPFYIVHWFHLGTRLIEINVEKLGRDGAVWEKSSNTKLGKRNQNQTLDELKSESQRVASFHFKRTTFNPRYTHYTVNETDKWAKQANEKRNCSCLLRLRLHRAKRRERPLHILYLMYITAFAKLLTFNEYVRW